jgi:hypothetical protein
MKIRFLSLFVLVLFSFSLSFSQEFSTYDEKIKIYNDKLIVEKTIGIKNKGKKPYVPGDIVFRINEAENFKLNESSIEIRKLDGSKIPFSIYRTSNYKTIIARVFMPLIPGYEYKFNLSYEIIYDKKGLLFYSLEIPLKIGKNITINQGSLIIELENDYKFTYFSAKNYTINENILKYNINSNSPDFVKLEYSYIPLKIFNLKGSILFWGIIDLLLILLVIKEIKKEINNLKKRNS